MNRDMSHGFATADGTNSQILWKLPGPQPLSSHWFTLIIVGVKKVAFLFKISLSVSISILYTKDLLHMIVSQVCTIISVAITLSLNGVRTIN